MTKFTPKATRFIDAAVDEMADREVRAIWSSVRHDPGSEMPDRVARAALSALDHYERQLWTQLTKYPVDEDEAADLSNDLGFVRSVESDLRRQVDRR